MPGTRKLGRPTAHRMSMLKGMVTFLLEKGQIETTATRAKEVSALADKMVTLGKANTLASKRQAMAFLKKEDVVYKLFNEIAPAYSERQGGYTRVLKTGPRRGDGAEMAIIALVDAKEIFEAKTKGKKKAEKAEPVKETKKAAPKKKEAEKATETKKPAKKAAAKVEKAEEKPAEKKAAKPRAAKPKVTAEEVAVEAPIETVAETAIEAPVEAPVETVVEAAAEEVTEAPAE